MADGKKSMQKNVPAVAPVAQKYHVTSDTLGREFDPGKRDFLTEKLKNENKKCPTGGERLNRSTQNSTSRSTRESNC